MLSTESASRQVRHVVIKVGDVGEAPTFSGRPLEFERRDVSEASAFTDLSATSLLCDGTAAALRGRLPLRRDGHSERLEAQQRILDCLGAQPAKNEYETER